MAEFDLRSAVISRDRYVPKRNPYDMNVPKYNNNVSKFKERLDDTSTNNYTTSGGTGTSTDTSTEYTPSSSNNYDTSSYINNELQTTVQKTRFRFGVPKENQPFQSKADISAGALDQYVIFDSRYRNRADSNMSKGLYTWDFTVESKDSNNERIGVRFSIRDVIEMEIADSFKYPKNALYALRGAYESDSIVMTIRELETQSINEQSKLQTHFVFKTEPAIIKKNNGGVLEQSVDIDRLVLTPVVKKFIFPQPIDLNRASLQFKIPTALESFENDILENTLFYWEDPAFIYYPNHGLKDGDSVSVDKINGNFIINMGYGWYGEGTSSVSKTLPETTQPNTINGGVYSTYSQYSDVPIGIGDGVNPYAHTPATAAFTSAVVVNGDIFTSQVSNIAIPPAKLFKTSGAANNFVATNNGITYYVWYNINGGNSDPMAGTNSLPIALNGTESANAVAVLTGAALANTLAFNTTIISPNIVNISNATLGASAGLLTVNMPVSNPIITFNIPQYALDVQESSANFGDIINLLNNIGMLSDQITSSIGGSITVVDANSFIIPTMNLGILADGMTTNFINLLNSSPTLYSQMLALNPNPTLWGAMSMVGISFDLFIAKRRLRIPMRFRSISSTPTNAIMMV